MVFYWRKKSRLNTEGAVDITSILHDVEGQSVTTRYSFCVTEVQMFWYSSQGKGVEYVCYATHFEEGVLSAFLPPVGRRSF